MVTESSIVKLKCKVGVKIWRMLPFMRLTSVMAMPSLACSTDMEVLVLLSRSLGQLIRREKFYLNSHQIRCLQEKKLRRSSR